MLIGTARGALAFALPACLTVLVLAPLSGAHRLGDAYVVLGAVLALTDRRTRAVRSLRGFVRALVLPVAVTVVAAGLGSLVVQSRHTAGALFVVVVVVATQLRRYGPAASRWGSLLLLPFLALLVAPVAVRGHGIDTASALGWLVLTVVVAIGSTVLVRSLLPPAPLSTRALEHAVGQKKRRRAAIELDRRIPPGDTAARLAVAAVEWSEGSAASVTELRVALAGVRPHDPAPAERPGHPVHTRFAVQAGLGLTAAVILGQAVFPEHWTWTVLTAFTVASGARSRGDVVLKAGQRLLGASAGAVVSTGLASLLGGHARVSVALMLAVLAVGSALRDRNYAWWAGAVTSCLGLLYGILGVPTGPGVLGERVLAVLLGGACAVLPALAVRPVRTGSVALKRAADATRALRAYADEPTVASLRGWDATCDGLHDALAPLRRLQRREHGWEATLLATRPDALRVLVDGDRAARGRVLTACATLGADLRAARDHES